MDRIRNKPSHFKLLGLYLNTLKFLEKGHGGDRDLLQSHVLFSSLPHHLFLGGNAASFQMGSSTLDLNVISTPVSGLLFSYPPSSCWAILSSTLVSVTV